MKENLEKTILGTLLVHGQGVEDVDLEPGDFSTRGAVVFQAIVDLFEAGKPHDLVSVLDYLDSKGLISKAGGRKWVRELAMYANIPSLLSHYSDLLRERSRRERLALLGEYLSDALRDPGVSTEDLLAEVDHVLTQVEKKRKDDVIQIGQVHDSWEERVTTTGKIVFPWTGLRQLVPELLPGDLVLVAGRPSCGKSSLLLSLGRLWAAQGKRVLVVSMEMSKEQIYERLLASWCGVSLRRIRNPDLLIEEERDRLVQAKKILKDTPLFVLDDPDVTPYKLRAVLRRHKDVDVLLLDYIQLMRSGRSHGKKYEEVSYISRALKVMTMEHELVTLAAAQLNRDTDKRGEESPPQLSDLRDSSALESDADVVLLLWRKSQDDPGSLALRVGKNRNGPVGYLNLSFRPETTSFEGTSEAFLDREGTPFEDEVGVPF